MSDQGAGNKNRNDRRGGGRRPFGKPRQRPDGQNPRPEGQKPRSDERGRNEQGKARPAAFRENLAQVVTPPPPSSPPPDCPLCGKPIMDISSALAEKASKAPAHFDCVLNSLSEIEKLGSQERLVYLGCGSFAVVEGNPQTPQKFAIIRKIQYEERDSKPDWRKDLNRAVIR
jgi:hypothetical protein